MLHSLITQRIRLTSRLQPHISAVLSINAKRCTSKSWAHRGKHFRAAPPPHSYTLFTHCIHLNNVFLKAISGSCCWKLNENLEFGDQVFTKTSSSCFSPKSTKAHIQPRATTEHSEMDFCPAELLLAHFRGSWKQIFHLDEVLSILDAYFFALWETCSVYENPTGRPVPKMLNRQHLAHVWETVSLFPVCMLRMLFGSLIFVLQEAEKDQRVSK